MIKANRNSLCLYTDESLVALSKDGATNAYEVLVERHSAPLYRFLLRRSGNAATSEELAQEAFFRAWQRIKDFDNKANFRSWLFSIANNLFLDFLRQEKSRKLRESDWANTVGGETQAPIQENNQLLAQLLSHFSNDQAVILQLFYGEEFTHSEISDILNIPLGSVKSIITRAREKMQSLLSLEFEKGL